MIDLWVYTGDQDVTPKVVDTVNGILREKFLGELFHVRTWDASDPDRRAKKVLVFGKFTDKGEFPNIEFIYTYSIAQMMTKANAATVLTACVERYINKPVVPPFDNCFGTGLVWANLSQFNYDAPIAIDIETSGNLGKEHTPEEVGLLSIAFYQPGRAPVVIVPVSKHYSSLDRLQVESLRSLLPKFTKAIYHNGKFDTRVLNRVLGVELEVWADTMLMHHTLNQAAGTHGLKPLAQLYLGAPDWEEGISKHTKGGGHYELIPRNLLVEYNGMDVYWTYKLWELFAPQIEADEEAQKAYFFEQEVAKFLLKVEQRGIPFNGDYAAKLASEMEADMATYKEALQAMTWDTFNPNSPQQVKKALAETFGAHVITTNEAQIEELKRVALEGTALHRFCTFLIGYRKASKMKGTYAEGWAKHARNGKVHPTFLVHGTSTGRLSSTSPNAQNVPRDKKVRKMVAV